MVARSDTGALSGFVDFTRGRPVDPAHLPHVPPRNGRTRLLLAR
jgi:hypothetical protein